MTSRIAADLAQLAHLARDGGLDLGQVSLRVKADLLMSTLQPAAEDIAAFAELGAALIPVVDEPTAIILARKLAGWRHAPVPVLEALKARGGPVLVALLRHGMALPTQELEEIAAQGESEAALAVAERADLSAATILVLLARDERAVDLAILANAAAPLPRAGLDMLLARAAGDPAYAPALLARHDLVASELTPLFLQAGAERRAAMLASLAAIEALGPAERGPRLTPDDFAGWLATAADDHDGAFGAIANHLGSAALAPAMAQDMSRDLTALALIASGASVEDATRFLIRLGDAAAHSVERIFAVVALMRAVSPAVARRVVMQVAGEAQRSSVRRGVHLPAMDPSGTPKRAGATKPEGRRLLDDVLRTMGLGRSRA